MSRNNRYQFKSSKTMTQDEIIKNNLLIAEFMGAKYIENWKPKHANDDYQPLSTWVYDIPPTEYSCLNWDIKHMQYHLSWEWLLPVLEKMENDYSTEINSTFEWNGEKYIPVYYCKISEGGTRMSPSIMKEYPTKKEAVYNTVVEFITNHNKTK